MVPVSLSVSLEVEGIVLPTREPWIVACEYACQSPVSSPPSPERTYPVITVVTGPGRKDGV